MTTSNKSDSLQPPKGGGFSPTLLMNGYDFSLNKDFAVELGKKIRLHEIPYDEVLKIIQENIKKARSKNLAEAFG